MSSETINITKIAAAKRQLVAAIRMYFLEEEELAIHTITSAVYSTLKDIKHSKGGDEVEDIFSNTFFYLIRDYHRGVLPNDITSNLDSMTLINELVAKLPITADFVPSDVKVSMSTESVKNYWKQNNKTANFLKHADKDITGTLNPENIDNRMLLMKCVNAYRDIAPDDLGNEGIIFSAFVSALNPAYRSNESPYDAIVERLKIIPKDDLNKICYDAVLKMNKSNK